jgi:hypothetical protein
MTDARSPTPLIAPGQTETAPNRTQPNRNRHASSLVEAMAYISMASVVFGLSVKLIQGTAVSSRTISRRMELATTVERLGADFRRDVRRGVRRSGHVDTDKISLTMREHQLIQYTIEADRLVRRVFDGEKPDPTGIDVYSLEAAGPIVFDASDRFLSITIESNAADSRPPILIDAAFR